MQGQVGSMSRQSNVTFSYLLTVGVVSFTRYSILPWCLWNLNKHKYDSWTKVVPAYGFLLSSMQCGHAVGQLLISLNATSTSLHSTSFGLLSGSYICLCLVDRYSLLLAIFFALGLSGSLLSGVSINLDRSVVNVAFVRNPTDLEINKTVQRTIICFVFSTLVSGYLYDSNPSVHFPLFKLMIIVSSACLLMSAYFGFLSCYVRRKWKSRYGGSGGGGGGGPSTSSRSTQNSNSNSNATAAVEAYTGEVPENFLSFHSGNLAKAREAYGKFLHWKRVERIDELFTTPQQGFDKVLQYYPHAIHGYSLDGCVVCYELLGKGDAAKLKASGVTVPALTRHFMLRNELCFERLLDPAVVGDVIRSHPGSIIPSSNPRPNLRRIMVVLDLKGIGIFSVNSDVLAFLGQSGAVIDNYYPEQVARLVIVNAPSFFGAIFGAIKPVLPASVQSKIDILSDMSGLAKYIHPSQRPRDYGGTSDLELRESKEQKAFVKLAEDWSRAPAPATAPASSSSSARTSAGDVPATSRAVIPADSKGDTSGWFRSLFARRSAPKAADLGGRNSYFFNPHSEKWELEFDDRSPGWEENDDTDTVVSFDGSKPGTGRAAETSAARGVAANTSLVMSSGGSSSTVTPGKSAAKSGPSSHHKKSSSLSAAQIEDHGLILAIQAAHVAKSYSSDNISALGGHDHTNLEAGGSGGESSSSAVHSQHNEAGHGRVSSDIFMMVGAMHILCAMLHAMMVTLIPVWLVSQVSSGGLGYSVKDLALVLSTTAMFVLHLHIFFVNRLEYCLKASPVRTLRIAIGFVVALCFVLPLYLNITTFDTSSGTSFGMGSPAAVPTTAAAVVEDTSILVHQDYHTHILSNVNHNLPSRSPLTLWFTSFLFSFLFAASFVCRKATNILFHLTLHSSFTSPTAMRGVVNHVIEVLAPLLACLLYSVIYGLRMRSPMNSSFFLSLSACGLLLIYMGSLLLTVNFRGDYGLMTDSPNQAVLQPAITSVGGGSGKSDRSAGLRSRQAGGRPNSPAWGVSGGLNSGRGFASMGTAEAAPQDVFSIPAGDLSLLFSQVAYSYGSKLYNLRDDFKDL